MSPPPIAERYELRSLIGSGGMGEVYDAFDVRLQRSVAVKILRPGLASDPAMVKRVEAETRLAARIHHPNVVAVLDAGDTDGTPFIVMERLPGTNLRDRFRAGPLTDDEIRAIGIQVLRGVAAAHELGVVHRDVKPSNVLLAHPDHGPGLWKVADFGIATSLGTETTLTATGEVLGSPAYLAPERADGGAASAASDIFSVGVLLYEAATGTRPVERDDAIATVMAIREGAGVPLGTRRPDLDPSLRSAIERALEMDPAARWPNAEAFALALGPQGETPVRDEPTLPLSTADPTARLAVDAGSDAVRETTAVLPSGATGRSTERAMEPAVDARHRGFSTRRADPGRALRIALAAALSLILLLGVITLLVAVTGEDTPARKALPTVDADVPEELRDPLEQLGEAITP